MDGRPDCVGWVFLCAVCQGAGGCKTGCKIFRSSYLILTPPPSLEECLRAARPLQPADPVLRLPQTSAAFRYFHPKAIIGLCVCVCVHHTQNKMGVCACCKQSFCVNEFYVACALKCSSHLCWLEGGERKTDDGAFDDVYKRVSELRIRL